MAEINKDDCFVVKGKLALPYQYFAGRMGSRFIIALRDRKKITGVRCERCDRVFVPPRQTCEGCQGDLSEAWVDLDDTGTVTGFTVIRYKEPHQPCEPPYILALVQLDGADTPLVHIVRGIEPEAMEVGLRVKAVFADQTTSTIMDISHFAPA
ncbi:MAG: Zn-ribbon domain-containing OB-fold protein [Proteobacteria bacterium]|nr:Zn-ribbon domain-containing OB-fold protein [Pseudomonadota bacterium]